MTNTILKPGATSGQLNAETVVEPAVDPVVDRIAQRSATARNSRYTNEVSRLLEAAVVTMAKCGTTRSPRLVDVLAEAELSTDIFYRHFSSKDELVASVVEMGTAQVVSYLEHQMSKVDEPSEKVRSWVAGVMGRAANQKASEITRAVVWNSAALSDTRRPGSSHEPMAAPLVTPFAELGSSNPERQSNLVCHTVIGRLEEFLWRRESPSQDDIDQLCEFVLALPQLQSRQSA